MKVGDLVVPYNELEIPILDYGIGVILDSYEDDVGLLYFEIQWQYDRQWFAQDEIKVVSEGR